MNNFGRFSPIGRKTSSIFHYSLVKRLHYSFFIFYDARACGIFAAFNIFSINIPYPVVGSFIITCVTAPTSLPFWMMGLPLTSVVNIGQQFLEFYMILIGNIYSVFQYHYTYKFFTLYLRFYGDTTLGR